MAKLQQWLARVNAMTLRERAIILAALAGALIYLWQALLIAPVNRQRTQLHAHIATVQHQAAELEGRIAKLQSGGYRPAAERQARLTALHGQIQRLDARLQDLTGGLIDPAQMAKVLQQMLDRDGALTLVSVESIPPKPLVDDKDGKTPVAQVYMRGVRIKFHGSFMDTLHYLKALEGLPWRLFWGGITYQVKDYPDADATLVVYTLSMQKGWIGV